MRDYIYVLNLAPKYQNHESWGDREKKIIDDHLSRLQRQKKRGIVKYVGKTDLPVTNAQNFGLVVFEAKDDTMAELFMQSDPAVMNKMMTAQCFPFNHVL